MDRWKKISFNGMNFFNICHENVPAMKFSSRVMKKIHAAFFRDFWDSGKSSPDGPIRYATIVPYLYSVQTSVPLPRNRGYIGIAYVTLEKSYDLV
jgi:hypothetical protein